MLYQFGVCSVVVRKPFQLFEPVCKTSENVFLLKGLKMETAPGAVKLMSSTFPFASLAVFVELLSHLVMTQGRVCAVRSGRPPSPRSSGCRADSPWRGRPPSAAAPLPHPHKPSHWGGAGTPTDLAGTSLGRGRRQVRPEKTHAPGENRRTPCSVAPCRNPLSVSATL